MQVKIMDQELSFEQNSAGISKLLLYVESMTKEHNLVLSHLIVDDVEVYDAFEQYLVEQSVTISRIEAIVYTREELKQETIRDAWAYTKDSIAALHQLSEQFSVNPEPDTWVSFEQFLEAVSWLNQVEQQFRGSNRPGVNDFSSAMNKLSEILQETEGAIVDKDYGLVADIIQFEITSTFAELQKALFILMNKEVA